MRFPLVLAVAAGGFIGAPCRYLLDRFVSTRVESELPWGTFAINASGSLVLGVLIGLSLAGHLPLLTKTLLGTGFCGAFTTFSTYTFETVRLIEEGSVLEALGYALVSVVVGLLVAGAGVVVGLAL